MNDNADDIGQEAVDVANAIQGVIRGRSTAAVYIGIAMVLGAAEARAKRPDLANLMRLIHDGARAEFGRVRRDRR